MAYTGIVSGVRAATTAPLAANQKPDIDTVLKVLEPYQSPFMQFLFFSGKKSKPVTSKSGKFSWFETEYFPHQTTVTEAIAASTTLTLSASNVATKAIFKLYDIVYIEATDEQAYVSSVTAGSGSDVILTHIAGTGSLSNVTSTGSYLKIIGSTNIENNTTPVSMTVQEVEKYNYLNLMLESVANTGRDQAGSTYSDGLTHAEQVQKKMKEFKLQLERNMIYSKSNGYAGTGLAYRTWGEGLNGRITTNVSANAGALTEDIWDSYLKDIFAKGSNRRIHYCGADQLASLNKIIKDKIGNLPNGRVTEYGVTLYTYYHGQGSVDIVYNPVLDGKFSKYGFTVDPEKVMGRHMANDDTGSRKFRLESNVQTPGADRKESKLLMDIGVQIVQEEVFGKIYHG